MILNEIYRQEPAAYQDLSNDNSQIELSNLRKTRLTLRQINKLRQLNDIRAFEYKQKLDRIRTQYAPPPAPPGI